MTAERRVEWLSTPPVECQLCGESITQVFYDARTFVGPWACVCPACFHLSCVGLGLGRGQRYEREAEGGPFVKTKG